MHYLRSLMLCLFVAGFAYPALSRTVVIATNPQGSIYYTAGASLAKLISEKTDIEARVVPTAGSSSNIPSLNQGRVDFVVMGVVDTFAAYEAKDHFAGMPPATNVRLVGAVFQIQFGIAVADDSPYRKLSDLKGARMPSRYTSQKVVVPYIEAILATGGTRLKDMKPFPVTNYVQGIAALGEGKVDATGIGPGMGAAQEVHAQLSSRGGLRLLPMETSPEAVKAMRQIIPSARIVTVKPSKRTPSVREETPVLTASVFLATHKDMPADLVYKVTKVIQENKDALVKQHPVFRSLDPNAMAEVNATPYHPGARKVFENTGQWPPKID